jgi:23S rRNA (guanine745-N1)-methyltransferase
LHALDRIAAHLSCPLCTHPLTIVSGSLRCSEGHNFDRAAHGYVSLLTRPPTNPGDDATMVDARARFLGAGHFAPLADAVAKIAAEHVAPEGLLVEIGAGTGFYLARVLDGLAERLGLALDVSRYAARRAARAHARMAAAVADATARLPLPEARAALILDVFAPRNASEFARVLRPDGALLLVTPSRDHMRELRAPLGLLEVDPEKEMRLGRTLDPHFCRAPALPLSWTMELDHEAAAWLVGMGPSARHLDRANFTHALAALPTPVRVTASVQIQVARIRG